MAIGIQVTVQAVPAAVLVERLLVQKQFDMALVPFDNGPDPDSPRPAVIGLIVVALLVIAGYLLFSALRQNSQMEDCLMSGRKNCAPIEAPSSGR